MQFFSNTKRLILARAHNCAGILLVADPTKASNSADEPRRIQFGLKYLF